MQIKIVLWFYKFACFLTPNQESKVFNLINIDYLIDKKVWKVRSSYLDRLALAKCKGSVLKVEYGNLDTSKTLFGSCKFASFTINRSWAHLNFIYYLFNPCICAVFFSLEKKKIKIVFSFLEAAETLPKTT